MKRLRALVLVGVVFAAGCARPATPSADSSQNITGSVVAGPMCPVESLNSPCPPKPLPSIRVEVVRGGDVIARATTDGQGRFSVSVSPGTYEVRAAAGQQAFMSARTVDVTVRRGENANVTIRADSGIR